MGSQAAREALREQGGGHATPVVLSVRAAAALRSASCPRPPGYHPIHSAPVEEDPTAWGVHISAAGRCQYVSANSRLDLQDNLRRSDSSTAVRRLHSAGHGTASAMMSRNEEKQAS